MQERNEPTVAFVSALYNLKRDTLTSFHRPWTFYTSRLNDLQKCFQEANVPLVVYCDSQETQASHTSHTEFFDCIEESLDVLYAESDWMKHVDSIRTDSRWLAQASWLKDSPQALLPEQNLLVLNKVLYSLRAIPNIRKKWPSVTHVYWIDAGISSTVNLDVLLQTIQKGCLQKEHLLFFGFPQSPSSEVHGFEWQVMKTKYLQMTSEDISKSIMVLRGGLFGGPLKQWPYLFDIQETLLRETLYRGLMGTEESLFSILAQQQPHMIRWMPLDSNGLIQKGLEDLLELKEPLQCGPKRNTSIVKRHGGGTGLYVLSFESPYQFETLCESMKVYDAKFLSHCRKFLINNGSSSEQDPSYKDLCEKQNFTLIRNSENLGIMGGRLCVAHHFHESDLDEYFFFEDDMAFVPASETKCRSGFLRQVPDLMQTCVKILHQERLDFLKLNWSEFFGTNEIQWAWQNVPKEFRDRHWATSKPPKTQITSIQSLDGLPQALGQIFLCNWPILMSKQGNYKCQIETPIQQPQEQTYMSHAFQMTVKGLLKSAVLLATPTEHNRFDHQTAQRKENVYG